MKIIITVWDSALPGQGSIYTPFARSVGQIARHIYHAGDVCTCVRHASLNISQVRILDRLTTCCLDHPPPIFSMDWMHSANIRWQPVISRNRHSIILTRFHIGHIIKQPRKYISVMFVYLIIKLKICLKLGIKMVNSYSLGKPANSYSWATL